MNKFVFLLAFDGVLRVSISFYRVATGHPAWLVLRWGGGGGERLPYETDEDACRLT